jgi:molybdenum cofactor biosynthesis protein B
MGHKEHKEQAPHDVRIAVITVSDSRTVETDSSGQTIMEMIRQTSHRLTAYHLIKDEPTEVVALLRSLCENASIDAVIINGGTGISRRDSTYEAVTELYEKIISGFGEIFRFVSYQAIGSAAIMSRASAGVYRQRIIISLPGSVEAVTLAMRTLIIPEIAHMVYEVKRT